MGKNCMKTIKKMLDFQEKFKFCVVDALIAWDNILHIRRGFFAYLERKKNYALLIGSKVYRWPFLQFYFPRIVSVAIKRGVRMMKRFMIFDSFVWNYSECLDEKLIEYKKNKNLNRFKMSLYR